MADPLDNGQTRTPPPEAATTADEFLRLVAAELEQKEREEQRYREQPRGLWERVLRRFAVI